jgi:hypothetical protein
MTSVTMNEPKVKIDKFKFLVLKTYYTSRLTHLDKYFMKEHEYRYECFDEDEPEEEPMPMIVAICDKLWGKENADGGIKVYNKNKLNEFEDIIGIPHDSFQDCKKLDGTIIFTSTNNDKSLSFSDLGYIIEMIGTEGPHSYCAFLSAETLFSIEMYGDCNEVLLAEYDCESG